MNPSEFIQFGIKSMGGGTEVHFRSAISRIYYGVFHTANQLLNQKCGIDLPIHEAHAKPSDVFNERK